MSGALFSMLSGDLLELDDEQRFGGMVAGSYYEIFGAGDARRATGRWSVARGQRAQRHGGDADVVWS